MANDYNSFPPPANDGLTDNVAGGLAYITVIPAIIFLLLAPYNRRGILRFHSFQCIFLFGAVIVSSLLHLIPFLGWILGTILYLVVIVFWIIACVQAFLGKKFVVPVVGPLAEQAANS